MALILSNQVYAQKCEISSKEFKDLLKTAGPNSPDNEKKISNRMLNCSFFIINFSKGDTFQFHINGEIFKSLEKTPSIIEVQKPFSIKLPMGKGDIKISEDMKNYKDLSKAFHGSIALTLENMKSEILTLNSNLKFKNKSK